MTERQRHLATTPPLGRRLGALSAVVSLMASIAVLVVAVPRGISSTGATEEDAPPTTVAPVKGNVRGLTMVVDETDRATPAIPLGNGCWLVSASDVAEQTPRWITGTDGERIEVSTLGEVPSAGLVVVKAASPTAPDASVAFDAFPHDHDEVTLDSYRIVDNETNTLFSIAPSLSMSDNARDIPITTSAPIRRLAAVVDEAERIVGIVVRRGYSTWLLGGDTIETIVSMTIEP